MSDVVLLPSRKESDNHQRELSTENPLSQVCNKAAKSGVNCQTFIYNRPAEGKEKLPKGNERRMFDG